MRERSPVCLYTHPIIFYHEVILPKASPAVRLAFYHCIVKSKNIIMAIVFPNRLVVFSTRLLVFAFALALALPAEAQLITMSNKCFKRMEAANADIEAGNYEAVLSELDGILDKCSAKDAQEQANYAKARALNNLERYGEALEAANAALAAMPTSINGLFQRGIAYAGLGQGAESKADFDQIIALTEKNQNIAERASIFVELADLSWKQGMEEEAVTYMNQALFYDDDNPDYYILRGDMKSRNGDLDGGFNDYDKAVALGRNDLEMYTIRSQAMIGAMQDKYGTTNSNELAKAMSSDEKSRLCAELGNAFDKGLKDMQLDLFRALICK